MIRRAAILMLIAAFSLATTPSFACTGISLKAKDGAAIRSRTLEFGFPLQSNVLVVPAGKEFSGTLPGGGKGLTYKSRYGIVGANALGATATIDVERSGLVDRSVLFPGHVGAWKLRYGRGGEARAYGRCHGADAVPRPR
ncbi:MAG: hypothetical protein MUP20_00205, partial [Methyloceanibacter sp.]|nr:hypothetical protein [Methyloceanibacter sp.]